MADLANRVLRRVPQWAIYLGVVLHIAWLFYLGATGALGAEPIRELERAYGEAGFQALILGLAVTPLRRFSGINALSLRRAIGLAAFTYICAHFLVWVVLDVQSLDRIWADIVKRPYISVGMAGFALMLPLVVTSNSWSIRKLRKAWGRLHKLVYAVALLGGLHFVMLTKGFQVEPLLYLAVLTGLLMLRAIPVNRRVKI